MTWTPLTMRTLFFASAILLSSTISSISQAKTLATTLSLPETQVSAERIGQRAAYQRAINALQQGRISEFHQIKEQLQNYPLYPYLAFYSLSYQLDADDIGASNISDIKHFLADYPYFHLNNQLTTQLRNRLAATQQWRRFLKETPRPTDDAGLCDYYFAQLQVGNRERAWTGAQQLWLTGGSQVANCDRLFDAWRQSNNFNADYYWARTLLALQAGQISFAQHMSQYLSPAQQNLVSLWASVHQNPKQLQNTAQIIQKVRSIPQAEASQVVLHGLHKWVKDDIEQALMLYEKYAKNLQFDAAQEQELLHYVARYLSYHYDTRSLYWLNKADPQRQNDTLLIRRIRLAINNHDWQAVNDWIQYLSVAERSSAQWRYWEIRAQLALLQKSSSSLSSRSPQNSQSLSPSYCRLVACSAENWRQAPTLFEESQPGKYPINWPESRTVGKKQLQNALSNLATERGYYSFLASEQLQQPLNFQQQNTDITQADLNRLVKSAPFQQMQELIALNQDAEANQLWRSTLKSLSPRERGTAAYYAALQGQYFKAITAASESSEKNNLTLRFPAAYATTIVQHAQRAQLEPAWVFALVRQESAFRADAKSPVGATGLMQLMPSTAKHIAKKTKTPLTNTASLVLPEKNVQLGTLYLREVYQSLNNNVFAATAAYNAGPGRAREWLATQNGLTAEEWIETIPIPETQDYVKNIITYRAIYRFQQNPSKPVLSFLK
jgi:soluble lytic murein transglycosylase